MNSKGFILVPTSLVTDTDDISVVIDGQQLVATLVGVDSGTGLAVVRVHDPYSLSAARFVPVDKSATVEDPLATRLLATLAKADAPMASRALRAALGVRNQLIGTALHTLLAQGRIRRDGRDGWSLSRSDTGSQPL